MSRVAIIGAGLTTFMRRALETPKELSWLAAKAAPASAQMIVADIETVYFPPFHFARDEVVRICVAKGERFLRRAYEREITNAISKHQRAAGERAQDVDDHGNAARLRRTREQAPSLNFHCLQF